MTILSLHRSTSRFQFANSITSSRNLRKRVTTSCDESCGEPRNVKPSDAANRGRLRSQVNCYELFVIRKRARPRPPPSLILFSVFPHVSDDTYHSIGNYPVTKYRCGVRAGDRVRLRRDIGKHPTGDIWSVLRGAAEEPVVDGYVRPMARRTHGATTKTFLQRSRSCHAMPLTRRWS
jgi:hypothetical protein